MENKDKKVAELTTEELGQIFLARKKEENLIKKTEKEKLKQAQEMQKRLLENEFQEELKKSSKLISSKINEIMIAISSLEEISEEHGVPVELKIAPNIILCHTPDSLLDRFYQLIDQSYHKPYMKGAGIYVDNVAGWSYAGHEENNGWDSSSNC